MVGLGAVRDATVSEDDGVVEDGDDHAGDGGGTGTAGGGLLGRFWRGFGRAAAAVGTVLRIGSGG
jgi:hypothetical protein